jgi:hypothetical protein
MATQIVRKRRTALWFVGAMTASLFFGSPANADLKNVTGPNGHSYDVIADPDASWSQANAAAAATGGHLVTITSATEQSFVEQLLVNANAPAGSYWIGLAKTGGVSPGPTSAADYGWTTGEPQTYQNWLVGQPDNNGNNESVAGILWSRPGDSTVSRRGFWNDLPENYQSSASPSEDLNNGGYIVERSSPAAVPLPPALLIAPIGMLMAWRAKRWVGRRS